MIKSVGLVDPVLIYGKPAYERAGRPFVLVNLDTQNPVWYDSDPTVTAGSNVIYPLGRAGFDGGSDVYASTLTPGVSVVVMQLIGHTGWDAGPVQTAAALQRSGVPPSVPDAMSAASVNQGPGGGGVFHTFAADAQIWACHLSFAAATSSSYMPGLTSQLYAKVLTGSGIVLSVVELALADASQVDNGDGDTTMPGIPLAAGDTLKLDINAGDAITNAVMRASTVVLYS